MPGDLRDPGLGEVGTSHLPLPRQRTTCSLFPSKPLGMFFSSHFCRAALFLSGLELHTWILQFSWQFQALLMHVNQASS